MLRCKSRREDSLCFHRIEREKLPIKLLLVDMPGWCVGSYTMVISGNSCGAQSYSSSIQEEDLQVPRSALPQEAIRRSRFALFLS